MTSLGMTSLSLHSTVQYSTVQYSTVHYSTAPVGVRVDDGGQAVELGVLEVVGQVHLPVRLQRPGPAAVPAMEL